MSGCNIRLVFIITAQRQYTITKDAYTSEITFLALHRCISVFIFEKETDYSPQNLIFSP